VGAFARIDVDSVVRAATPVNGGVATRDTIGIGTRDIRRHGVPAR
jgi:hypothetical protein